jgi:hypothetical protein
MEPIEIITAVVTVASTVSALVPEPRTRLGKRLKRIVDFFAVNLGHAKNKGVDR